MTVEVNAPIDELHDACRLATRWVRRQFREARVRLDVDGFDIRPCPDDFR